IFAISFLFLIFVSLKESHRIYWLFCFVLVSLGRVRKASENARYIGKTVVIRSYHGYFLTAHKPSGKEDKLDHSDKRSAASIFVVKDIDENKIALEIKEFGTYVHIPAPDSGKYVVHGPLDKTAELTFVKAHKEGYISIKCIANSSYLVLAEKKLFGRSILSSV
ncbi:hypothetical protein RFI_21317, partial [Reticulomyxa filosa]